MRGPAQPGPAGGHAGRRGRRGGLGTPAVPRDGAAAAAGLPRRPGDGRLRRADPRTSPRWSPRAGCRRCGWRCSPRATRNGRYAANPRYAETLASTCVPALRADWATEHAPVLMGQSLGALAALHAAWTRPGVFGGLFLQSGSFFTPELDPQESGYSHWDRVTGFVAIGARRRSAARDPPACDAGLRHRRGEPRQQPADGRRTWPRCGCRRSLGRGAGRPHLDLLARPARPTLDRRCSPRVWS